MTDDLQYVQWSDALLVGHSGIDEEHRGIFAFAAKLQDMDISNAPPSAVSEILCQLIEYASMHLGHEEELMRTSHYPMISGHSIEHWKFFRELTTLIDDYERGREDVLKRCFAFLTNWLTKHILINDIQLAEFLRNRGS